MAVCRIEKTKDYTVMANHHLRNKGLSLKAKGLLSLMLSLPEDWDYTVKGLAYICKDGIDSINGALKELETTGYMHRQRVRNDRGQLTTTEYTIREYPQNMGGDTFPAEVFPAQEIPILENPTQAIPMQEEHHQLNTYLQTIDKSKTALFNTETSNPYQSNPYGSKKTGYDEIGCETYEEVKEMVYENIEYRHFKQHGGIGMRERLNEIADIIIETLCSTKDTINIAGDDYPARLVKDKMLRIISSHIEYVFDCLNKNTTYVRNIKRYLLATLFNAPSTIDNYYSALVNHDLYSPNR
ncbi:helix-turn-helix domain-containing protein [Lachnospiraceae bacterium ZAX-1]